jgi:DNA-binding MarR family transcriptional regulator
MAPGGGSTERTDSGTIAAGCLAVKNLTTKIHGMETTDLIDRMNEAWRRERPDLDPSPLEVVGRVLVIARHLEKSVETTLKRYELTLSQFDILATLRRQGPGGRLTPKQLMRSVMLSSGGMTNRLDSLERAGLVERRADPGDRRGVVVGLTAKGRRLIDAATAARFAEAADSVPPLTASELQTLGRLLRKWLGSLTDPESCDER